MVNKDYISLQRLHTMEDWIELQSFNSSNLLSEISKFDSDWKKYHPTKKDNNRFGLSVTSLNGDLSGIPDLASLYDYEKDTGIQLHNHDINELTEVYYNSKTLQNILEPYKKWLGRCHFLRLDKGGYFPDHYDINKLDYTFEEIRFVGMVKNTNGNFKWIYDNKVLSLTDGTLYYFNANKRHCVFSMQNNVILLVITLKYDYELFDTLINNAVIK